MPKVSICIPAYNQVVYLKRTLDSILSQTYRDYEIIITDDTPGLLVKELVDQYDFDGRLHYFKNENALGTPRNWNEAIKKATGHYIKILHHDDWFSADDSLAYFMEAIEKEDAEMAFSDANVVYEKSDTKGFHSPDSKKIAMLAANPSVLFMENFIGAPSMIIYKNDKNIVFDENLKWLVDVDFYIRYLKAHKRFAYIPKPLITILAEGASTVTAECLNNRDIEVFENCYLFDKLKPTFDNERLMNSSRFLVSVFNRFNIKTLSELKQVGYNGTLPMYLKTIFYLDRLTGLFAFPIQKAKNLAFSVFNTTSKSQH